MPDTRYFLLFTVSLALLGLGKRCFLDPCKEARLKKKLFTGFIIFNALIVAGFIWSMVDFKFYWTIFVVFFLPIIGGALFNILTTEFCESCRMPIRKHKFWKPFEGCPACNQLFPNQDL